jgi:hypothetical protein
MNSAKSSLDREERTEQNLWCYSQNDFFLSPGDSCSLTTFPGSRCLDTGVSGIFWLLPTSLLTVMAWLPAQAPLTSSGAEPESPGILPPDSRQAQACWKEPIGGFMKAKCSAQLHLTTEAEMLNEPASLTQGVPLRGGVSEEFQLCV